MRLGEYGEPIVVAETVRDDWELEAAVFRSHPGNLFPSRVAWSAALRGFGRVVEVLGASAAAGMRPRKCEIVRVPKGDGTTRPAADMPLEDQVLLSALTELLRTQIPPDFVGVTGEGDQNYGEFEQFPLREDNVRYVLEADAASFYQNISHEVLAHELIGLTGRADATEALVRLLESWMGSTRGLPQGPSASNVLADIYISPAARALERAGFRFRRYSDDFRVLATTWREAREAQLVLERALYDLGLAAAPGRREL